MFNAIYEKRPEFIWLGLAWLELSFQTALLLFGTACKPMSHAGNAWAFPMEYEYVAAIEFVYTCQRFMIVRHNFQRFHFPSIQTLQQTRILVMKFGAISFCLVWFRIHRLQNGITGVYKSRKEQTKRLNRIKIWLINTNWQHAEMLRFCTANNKMDITVD